MYLPDHSHCLYCGNPIKEGEEYCDEDCRQLELAYQKQEKKKDLKFYFLIGASLVGIFVVGLVIRFLH